MAAVVHVAASHVSASLLYIYRKEGNIMPIMKTAENWKEEIVFLKGFAKGKGFTVLTNMIHCAEVVHKDQRRRGGLPYISHLTRVTNALLSLGLEHDPLCEEILATGMGHDTPEDHNVPNAVLIEEYGISEKVVANLQVLNKNNYTRTDGIVLYDEYYKAILLGGIATVLTKLADRCHNLSTMVGVDKVSRIERYIKETEDYVIPLAHNAVRMYPEYDDHIYTMRYHMEALLHALRALVEVANGRKEDSKEVAH